MSSYLLKEKKGLGKLFISGLQPHTNYFHNAICILNENIYQESMPSLLEGLVLVQGFATDEGQCFIKYNNI